MRIGLVIMYARSVQMLGELVARSAAARLDGIPLAPIVARLSRRQQSQAVRNLLEAQPPYSSEYDF